MSLEIDVWVLIAFIVASVIIFALWLGRRLSIGGNGFRADTYEPSRLDSKAPTSGDILCPFGKHV